MSGAASICPAVPRRSVVALALGCWLGPPPAAAGLTDEGLAALGNLRILVPTLAGGTLDLLARLLAQALAPVLRAPVTVLNLEGAAGEIALRRLTSEPADGRTWLLAQESLITINPSLYPRATSDILDGLAPVARIATSGFYLLVRADDPVTDVRDLVRDARSAAAPWPYGSGGVGTLHHLSTEALAAALQVPLLHVPYKGNAQAVQALVRGEIRLLMAGSSALPLVDGGRLRMLAVTAPRRSPAYPEVPALAEFVPHFEAANWFGIFARKAVPDTLLSEMRARLQTAVDSDDLRRAARERGQVDAGFLAGPTFISQILEDRQRYAGIVRRLGIAAPG